MSYTVKGRIYTADEGFVFHSKLMDSISKKIALPKPEMLEYFDIIPEPIPEEPEVVETPIIEEE